MPFPTYNNDEVVATEISSSNSSNDPNFFDGEIKTLQPEDHFSKPLESERQVIQESPFTFNTHYIKDTNDPPFTNGPTFYYEEQADGSVIKVPNFSGSATVVNPLSDPVKQAIIDNGLEAYETDNGRFVAPLSPLQPFTRSDPRIARKANLFTYNRTKLPIADLEFRKGFRHLFFTRPECYIVCNDNGIRLSEQALYDEDFSSAYTREPHLLEMLSPFYITGSWSQDGLLSNWNFLLSNRVQGFSPNGMSIGTQDNVTKSSSGYTVVPGSIIESDGGGTFDLTFSDTKYLECYECLRLWMLYISKRYKGYLAPSYNGYRYNNSFYTGTGQIFDRNLILHPYDRAIDYASTLFDIVTNESGTKIIYWCKYYGVYPTSASNSLSNESNMPITELTTNATFHYMYKLECVNKSLLEFNYNAGIVSKTGRLTHTTIESLPYLVRETTDDQIGYFGAAGMFVGSPYIVMGVDPQPNPRTMENTYTPYLRFANINNNPEINTFMNQGIINNESGENLLPVCAGQEGA